MTVHEDLLDAAEAVTTDRHSDAAIAALHEQVTRARAVQETERLEAEEQRLMERIEAARKRRAELAPTAGRGTRRRRK